MRNNFKKLKELGWEYCAENSSSYNLEFQFIDEEIIKIISIEKKGSLDNKYIYFRQLIFDEDKQDYIQTDFIFSALEKNAFDSLLKEIKFCKNVNDFWIKKNNVFYLKKNTKEIANE